jgi:1-acyl-sn-glycerol-3-phosphate acyltransferase
VSAAGSGPATVNGSAGRGRAGRAVPRSGGRIQYWLSTFIARVAVSAYLRLRVEGRERLPDGPALLCFNHQSWADPFVLVAALPARPDLLFFGPKEADMRIGKKNRLIALSRRGIPFRPDKRGLVEVARRVDALFERGSRLAIAPEGRIHAGERVVLPLDEGAAYFAVRAGVPVVPVAIQGLGWLRFGGTVRVRIGEPLPVIPGRATRAAVEAMSIATRQALLDLVADGRDREPPGPFGRWLTEVFQDWPEGSRPPIQDQY